MNVVEIGYHYLQLYKFSENEGKTIMTLKFYVTNLSSPFYNYEHSLEICFICS